MSKEPWLILDDKQMLRVLHLSFHVGCINDLQYVFKTLGHSIEYKKMTIPQCKVTAATADSIWEAEKTRFQSYDIIITSDTVALSYIFLRHLDELRPFLIILNTNRFDYNMYDEPEFYKLLQSVHHVRKKVAYIPVCMFETIWCGQKGVIVTEPPILPVGKWLKDDVFTGQYIRDDFGEINTSLMRLPPSETIFVQKYFNHTQFLDLPRMLSDFGISVASGGYQSFEEIAGFKGLVVLPDTFCKYFAFESIQNELLIFLPSQRFLLELGAHPGYFFNTEGSGGKITSEFINLCEWYKYPETRIFFDSFPDLFYKIQTTTHKHVEEKKAWMRHYAALHEKAQLERWNHLLTSIRLLQAGTAQSV